MMTMRADGVIPTAPERLMVARCLFCGVMGVWWECSCVSAHGIREGKLKRPRTAMKDGHPLIIIEDPELLRAARLAGVIKVADPVHKEPSVNTAAPPVNTETASVNTEEPSVNTAEESVNTGGDPVNSDDAPVNTAEEYSPATEDDIVNDARKAYRREWMRRQRAKRDGHRDG
jgi:hypothetical protein